MERRFRSLRTIRLEGERERHFFFPRPRPRPQPRPLLLSKKKKKNLAASTTSEALVALSALHGRDLSKALLLLEHRAVSLFVGDPSGRRFASVTAGGGGGGAEHHRHRHSTLAPHFCSCESFFFDVVGKGEKPACKHLIASQVAEALAEKKSGSKGGEREGGEGREQQPQQQRQEQQQQQQPASSNSNNLSPLAAFAPVPMLVPDDVLARLLIAG